MKYRKDGRKCLQCNKPLPSNRQKYCSYECSATRKYEEWRIYNPLRGKTSATTGAISELRVAVDLLSRGYNVFRALSPNCPCDLAILKEGKLLRVEVRTSYQTPTTGKFYRTPLKRDNGANIDVYAWVLANNIIYEPLLE